MADIQQAMNTPMPGQQPAEQKAPAMRGPRKTTNAARKRTKKAAVPKAQKAPKRRKAKKAAAPKPAKQKRARRGAIALDLQSATALLGSMHRTDLMVFSNISDQLSAQGIPSRKRLLAALNQVFGG